MGDCHRSTSQRASGVEHPRRFALSVAAGTFAQ
jgi:hypothetical protein